MPRLDYCIGLNRWKSAAIGHGVYARYRQGKKSAAGVNVEGFKRSIQRALEQGELAVDRLLSL